ncbi:MAG: helicase C-terminal domain-containing protein [Acidithiobacillus sp.]|jgi:Rad3-related DNA helicase|uniref:helicase C-terminal domain-containing protein n=1 Tax=Acidithiobacillus sp. TaxID=1872118 RepID=UPI00355EC529
MSIQWEKYTPYPKLRDEQILALETISHFFESSLFEQQIFILDAPTGIGKSAIGKALGSYFYEKYKFGTNYLTNNKYLEQQIIKDFPDDIKHTFGRSNFICKHNHLPCNQGECTKSKSKISKGKTNIEENVFKCEYKPKLTYDTLSPIHNKIESIISNYETYLLSTQFSHSELTSYFQNFQGKYKITLNMCEYWNKKINAINSQIALHNYSYFILENNYIGSFKKRYLLICDEGHKLEDIIINFTNFSLTLKDIDELGIPIKLEKHSFTEWNKIIQEIIKFLYGNDFDTYLENYIRTCEGQSEKYIEQKVIKLRNKQQKLLEDLQKVSKIDEKFWVIDYITEKNSKEIYKIDFRPIHAKEYMYEYLLGTSIKILIMSATILSKETFLETMGVEFEEMDNEGNIQYLSLNSPFPIEHRKIYYLPIAKINYQNQESSLDKIIPILEQLLIKYIKDKGIIHTKSYDLAQLLEKKLHSSRFLTHNPKNREQIIQQFQNSTIPYILVSPSAEEGLDLKDEQCRFIIILKIPFLNLGDKRIKKRLEENQTWYNWKTIQTIVQESGRGVRHIDDYCDTYILDEAFEQLLEYEELFPSWFMDAFEELDIENFK